jgi:hypothetical protein
MRLVDAVAPQKSDFARFKERLLGRTGEIPMNQVNAIVPERMQLRVGIPHRGGKLAAHAFERGYPVMVSANAFFDPRSETFKVPQYSPLQDMDVALDSAGFVALMNFVAKGPQKGAAGIYPLRISFQGFSLPGKFLKNGHSCGLIGQHGCLDSIFISSLGKPAKRARQCRMWGTSEPAVGRLYTGSSCVRRSCPYGDRRGQFWTTALPILT